MPIGRPTTIWWLPSGNAPSWPPLPGRADDYWAACRAYCDRLYGAHIRASGTQTYLDKTPEYSTIWPFVTRVYPDAIYPIDPASRRYPVLVPTLLFRR